MIPSSLRRRFRKFHRVCANALSLVGRGGQTARMGMGMGILVFWLGLVRWAPAQAPLVPAAAPSSGGAPLMGLSWTDVLITVIMLGVALLAVCRSSQRT